MTNFGTNHELKILKIITYENKIKTKKERKIKIK